MMNYWPNEQTIVTEYQVMTIPRDELLTKWTNNLQVEFFIPDRIDIFVLIGVNSQLIMIYLYENENKKMYYIFLCFI
jgi:hypothetical protein